MAEKGDMNRAKALKEDVASVYDRATTSLLKEDVFLHFAYADFEEVSVCVRKSKLEQEILSVVRIVCDTQNTKTVWPPTFAP